MLNRVSAAHLAIHLSAMHLLLYSSNEWNLRAFYVKLKNKVKIPLDRVLINQGKYDVTGYLAEFKNNQQFHVNLLWSQVSVKIAIS